MACDAQGNDGAHGGLPDIGDLGEVLGAGDAVAFHQAGDRPTDLALQVVDLDMGDEVRSVDSLSGGESFLVSLALALALSSLSSRQTQVESLFIDEGFGTLDPDSLDLALSSLDSLQAAGRQIGVISHVQTLVERIGVQIRVEALGGGESRVVLP